MQLSKKKLLVHPVSGERTRFVSTEEPHRIVASNEGGMLLPSKHSAFATGNADARKLEELRDALKERLADLGNAQKVELDSRIGNHNFGVNHWVGLEPVEHEDGNFFVFHLHSDYVVPELKSERVLSPHEKESMWKFMRSFHDKARRMVAKAVKNFNEGRPRQLELFK